MLAYEQELESTQVSKLKFWNPPREYQIPQPPPGHTYIPLKQNCLKAIYNPRVFSSYATISEHVNEENFKRILESANFVVKTPYFKYNFVRFLLFGLIAQSIFRIITAALEGDLLTLIIFSVVLIYSPILMRYGCAQYLTRMKKYEKVLNKALGYQNSSRLPGSGVVVEAGKMCLWLDFHTGNYEPPLQYVYAEPVYFEVGAQIIIK